MTAERDALQERLLRLQADFDNFRKRTARERNDMYLRANEDLVRELLPVLDHLDLALAADETGGESAFVKGVQLVADQFLAVLAKFGVRPFNAEGEPFDPQKHEAVSEEPSATISANVVISQISRGFMLGERLLRAPRVIVSSGPETRQEPAG
jgi:molecular chaperone GrpE